MGYIQNALGVLEAQGALCALCVQGVLSGSLRKTLFVGREYD